MHTESIHSVGSRPCSSSNCLAQRASVDSRNARSSCHECSTYQSVSPGLHFVRRSEFESEPMSPSTAELSSTSVDNSLADIW